MFGREITMLTHAQTIMDHRVYHAVSKISNIIVFLLFGVLCLAWARTPAVPPKQMRSLLAPRGCNAAWAHSSHIVYRFFSSVTFLTILLKTRQKSALHLITPCYIQTRSSGSYYSGIWLELNFYLIIPCYTDCSLDLNFASTWLPFSCHGETSKFR